MKEIFCDGVSRVILSRELVTLECYHLIYVGGDKGSHQAEPFFSITLPLHGLLEVVGTGEKILEHMTKIGMIHLRNAGTPVPAAEKAASPVEKKSEKKNAKSSSAPAKKSAPAPAKKTDSKPAAKPAEKPAPAKKSAPAPAKKAESKPAAKPVEKPAPAKKSAPAPAKKPAAKGKKSAK